MSTVKSLLNVLAVVGIIAWSGAVFIGVHFASHCSWPVSLSAAVACGLLMYFFLYLSRLYFDPDSVEGQSKSANTRKWVFFALYVLVSLVSAWWLLHGIAATSLYKEEIQPVAKTQLDELKTYIDDEHEPDGSYMQYVSEQKASYRAKNPNNLTNTDRLDEDVNDLGDLYVSASGYGELRDEISRFIKRARPAINNWDIFAVSKYVDELSDRKPQWEEKLVLCSRNDADKMQGEFVHVDFQTGSKIDPDLATPLFTPSTAGITGLGLGILVILQIVIILSWIAVCNNGRKGADGTSRLRGDGRIVIESY